MEELSAGTFRITQSDYKTMTVTDGPKDRTVQVPSVYHRVGCHAVMVPFEELAYPTLIRNTAASIKGRGMHWLHDIVEADLDNDPDSTRYFWQGDIFHYYDSIDQNIMMEQIRRYTADEKVLAMLDGFIRLLPRGLSKGLRSSQCLANIHLNDIDHVMAGMTPYYYRYCDDIVMLAGTKKELWRMRNTLTEMLGELGLFLKPSEAVRPVCEGIDFLGYVTRADDMETERSVYSLVRKRTKQKFARRLAKVKSRRRRRALIGSFFGMAAHGDCRHLLKCLISHSEYRRLNHTRGMKKFSEMGVSYTPADGKKRFPGKTTRLGNICNKRIEIHDYEVGVSTSQGEGRYVVSFFDPLKNEWGKFFTSSEEMKNILDQVSDVEDGFPFETVIESEIFDGNKVKYRFT